MITFNNEITVTRGETFTMNKVIQNKDGSPYCISSDLSNPYFLITVTNSKYEINNKYTYRKWLNLKDFPRFNSTTCISLNSIYTSADNTTPAYPNGFTQITARQEDDIDAGHIGEYYIARGYQGKDLVLYDYDDAVFSYTDTNGITTYKYATVDNSNNITWSDYSCYISTAFDGDVTREWQGQTYYYSIQLVDGDPNAEPDKQDTEMLLKIPFSTCIPILTSTKMSVMNNLDGGV